MVHMQLVAELETKFDVMLSTEQVIGMSTFEKATEALEAHGICFEP
jgi:acyl carrier protein